jgi:hypothetical protein
MAYRTCFHLRTSADTHSSEQAQLTDWLSLPTETSEAQVLQTHSTTFPELPFGEPGVGPFGVASRTGRGNTDSAF